MRTDGIWESHLPNRLGVSRESIRQVRPQFTEGLDWWTDGNRLIWSTGSLEKLASAVSSLSQAEPQAPQPPSEPSPANKIDPEPNLTQNLCLPEPPIIV
jgi:hypothetical protein